MITDLKRRTFSSLLLLCVAYGGCGKHVQEDVRPPNTSTAARMSEPMDQKTAIATLERDGAVFTNATDPKDGSPESATLKGPRFGDAQVALASIIATLKTLDLTESAVTNEGLKSLQNMPSLSTLILQNTHITTLAPLANVASLTGLDVTGTHLHESDLSALAGREFRFVEPFRKEVVSAWLVPPELVSSDWADSKDGALSVRLLVTARVIQPDVPIVILAELRNNTTKPLNVLRPFGDPFVGPRALKIVGPAGVIVPIMPEASYALGADSFAALAPGKTIRDRYDATPGTFPQSNLPGKYVLEYSAYRSTTENQQQAARKWINLPDLWVGEIDSKTVTLVKGK